MQSTEDLLSTYKSVHLNKKNVQTHFIGIPGIIWSLMLLLHLVKIPVELSFLAFELTVAMLITPLIIIYYLKLHLKLAIGMIVFMSAILYHTYLISFHSEALWIALFVFVICWVFQFIGHHYEKAKPAFFEDIMQLLVGPFFLMAEVYFILGLEKKLEETITPMAIEKRRQMKA